MRSPLLAALRTSLLRCALSRCALTRRSLSWRSLTWSTLLRVAPLWSPLLTALRASLLRCPLSGRSSCALSWRTLRRSLETHVTAAAALAGGCPPSSAAPAIRAAVPAPAACQKVSRDPFLIASVAFILILLKVVHEKGSSLTALRRPIPYFLDFFGFFAFFPFFFGGFSESLSTTSRCGS